MGQLMAGFISMRCTLCGLVLHVAFFFHVEDGIRDLTVTGVQTCALPISSWEPPFAGMPLALIDSKLVQPRTYGVSDDDFMAWVQQTQTFDVVGGTPGQTAQTIPAEWN